MAQSSRPDFPKFDASQRDASVDAAESFFVDALDEWRTAVGIERMTLAGHSLGGYLATAYALKYPARVAKLVLISPAGVPEQPADAEERMRKLPWWAVRLWNAQVTPMALIRGFGPFGNRFVGQYVQRRFPYLGGF